MSEEQNLTFTGPNSIGTLFARHTKQPEADAVALRPTVSDGGPTPLPTAAVAVVPPGPPKPSVTPPEPEMHPNGYVALELVRAGFPVTPVRVNGKEPFLEKWQQRPLSEKDEKLIFKIWGKRNYNVGLVCGLQPNGKYLVVIDVDVKDGKRGLQSLAAWETLYDLDTSGRQHITPSGGRHLLYYSDKPIPSNGGKPVVPGIDIRGVGGQAVAPGSTIDDVPYVLVGGHIPELPPALADFLISRRSSSASGLKKYTKADALADAWDKPENIARAIHYLVNDAPEAIEGCYGDNTSHGVIRILWDFQICESEAHLLFEEHYNATKCLPPWSESDAHRLVSSVYRGGDRPPGNADAKAEFGPLPPEILALLEAEPEEEGHNVGRASSSWADPTNLWAEECEPPDLALGVLPPALERWTRDEAMRLGITYGAAAVAAIVTTAAALSSGFRVQVKQHNTGHTEAPILWGAIVGQPGARKSPVLKAFMRPLEQIENEYAIANQTSLKEYNQKYREWKRKSKKDESLPEPPPPPQRRKIVQDITAESLALTLADNPNGLLCYSDELAQWAGNMDSYRPGKATSRDQPFWLSAKNGSSYTVDRVTRGSVSVPVNAVHVLGGIQPDVIRKLASGWGGNGMMPRFLLANMPRAAIAPDVEPDAAAQKVIDGAIRLMISLKPTEFFDTFKFSPEADLVRLEVVSFADTMQNGVDVSPPLEGWLSKLEGEWARIACVFHVLAWAAGRGALDPNSFPLKMISAETAERAARFLIDFQYPHQAYFYRTVAGLNVVTDTEARHLAGYLLAHPKETLDDRDIYRARRGLRGEAKRSERLDVTQTLEVHDWLRPGRRAHRDGKPAVWEINPKIYDGRFEARAAIERATRATQQESIAKAGEARWAISVLKGNPDSLS